MLHFTCGNIEEVLCYSNLTGSDFSVEDRKTGCHPRLGFGEVRRSKVSVCEYAGHQVGVAKKAGIFQFVSEKSQFSYISQTYWLLCKLQCRNIAPFTDQPSKLAWLRSVPQIFQAIKGNVVSDTVLNGFGRVGVPPCKRDCEMVFSKVILVIISFSHFLLSPLQEFLAPCTKVNLFDYRFSIDMLDPRRFLISILDTYQLLHKERGSACQYFSYSLFCLVPFVLMWGSLWIKTGYRPRWGMGPDISKMCFGHRGWAGRLPYVEWVGWDYMWGNARR